MTHEEAIEVAAEIVHNGPSNGKSVDARDWSAVVAQAAIAAYLEARGAVLCEKQDTWFDPVRNVTLHAALSI